MTSASPRLSSRNKASGRSRQHSPAKSIDRLGLFVFSFIGLVGVALACSIQLAYSPSIWTHLCIALPPVLLSCVLPIRLLRGWIVRNRFALRAQEQNVERNFAQMTIAVAHGSAAGVDGTASEFRPR